MSEDIIQFRVKASSLDQLREFADETQADLGCRAVARTNEFGEFYVDAYLTDDQLSVAEGTRREGITIERLDNFSATSRQRRSEVSRGNRYSNRGSVPRGLGVKE